MFRRCGNRKAYERFNKREVVRKGMKDHQVFFDTFMTKLQSRVNKELNGGGDEETGCLRKSVTCF